MLGFSIVPLWLSQPQILALNFFFSVYLNCFNYCEMFFIEPLMVFLVDAFCSKVDFLVVAPIHSKI
jgi:hypothetical protein